MEYRFQVHKMDFSASSKIEKQINKTKYCATESRSIMGLRSKCVIFAMCIETIVIYWVWCNSLGSNSENKTDSLQQKFLL